MWGFVFRYMVLYFVGLEVLVFKGECYYCYWLFWVIRVKRSVGKGKSYEFSRDNCFGLFWEGVGLVGCYIGIERIRSGIFVGVFGCLFG